MIWSKVLNIGIKRQLVVVLQFQSLCVPYTCVSNHLESID